MDASQAADWIRAAEGAKQGARRARRAFWVPLVIFGAITMVASALYRYPTAAQSRVPGFLVQRPSGVLGWFAGGFFLQRPELVSLFWLITLPLGYALTSFHYRRQARLRGVEGSVWPYVFTGLGLLVFLIATAIVGHQMPGDLWVRGMTPLLTVALGLFVLARTERSSPLALFAVAFFALSLLVNLYDLEGLFQRVGLSVPVPAINLIVPGGVMILAGAGFWATAGERRGSSHPRSR